MSEHSIHEFGIFQQEAVFVSLENGTTVVISQQETEEPYKSIAINICGPHNLDQLIAALSKIREAM